MKRVAHGEPFFPRLSPTRRSLFTPPCPSRELTENYPRLNRSLIEPSYHGRAQKPIRSQGYAPNPEIAPDLHLILAVLVLFLCVTRSRT
jgi:hypothetical protein